MTAFLVFFGLTALLVVGGVRGSLRLSTGRRVSSLRRTYAAPMHDTTEDEIARHSRKAWVTWCPCKLWTGEIGTNMLANAETLFRKGLGLSWPVRPGEQQMNKIGRTAMHQHAGTDSAMSMEPFTTVGFQKGCVFMKKFLLLLSLLFLSLGSVATVALARANVATQQSTAVAAEVACDAATPTPTPAHSTACGNVLYQQAVADLGVGKGVCYFDGQYTVNSKGCDGLEPPPINECNTTALTSTLDIVHEVLAVIPVGTVGRLFVFKTDAGGCGSVWTAYHDEGGTHLVNDVSIVDQSELTTEHGLDGTDKTKSVNGWESTFMLGYVPGVHYHAQVTVDGSTTAQVDVTA